MSWYHTNGKLRKIVQSLIIAGDAAAEKIVNQKYVLLEKASELAAYGHVFTANSLRIVYDERLRQWSSSATPHRRDNIDRMKRHELHDTIDRLSCCVRMLESAQSPESAIGEHDPCTETEIKARLLAQSARLKVLLVQMHELAQTPAGIAYLAQEKQRKVFESFYDAPEVVLETLDSTIIGLDQLKATQDFANNAISKASSIIATIAYSMKK